MTIEEFLIESMPDIILSLRTEAGCCGACHMTSGSTGWCLAPVDHAEGAHDYRPTEEVLSKLKIPCPEGSKIR